MDPFQKYILNWSNSLRNVQICLHCHSQNNNTLECENPNHQFDGWNVRTPTISLMAHTLELLLKIIL